jgi:hypothetical protein
LLLIFTTAALGQSVSPAGTLSGYQRQTTARKDSALHATDRYLHAGHPIKAKDTLPATKKAMPRLAPADSSAAPDPERFVPSLDHGSCKIIFFVPLPRDSADYQAPHTPAPAAQPTAPAPRVPFLQIHGNVLYNLNYYSRIDTPYNEQNIYQHTVQTWLDILVKGEYPFRIYLTNHFSNSSLFRNYSDYNFSYNNNGFLQHIKDLLRQQLLRGLAGQRQLDSLQRALNADWQKLKGLDQWRPNVDPKQQMVEAREREVRKTLQGSDTSANTHPPMDGLDSIYASKAKDADSIRKEIAALQGLLQIAHQRTQTGTTGALAEIQQMNNPAELRKKMPALGLSDSSLPKGYKTLMAIKSFNIGRTVVNYSELSAKNISVNGVQAEYNPSGYYAFAAGSVDYRFRDFIVQQPNQPRQYLNIYRIGQGLKDGNSVILTYFMGRRQLYNAATSDTSTAQVPSSFLMGLTLEGNYHLTKNILFTGEIAKSSSPSYSDTVKGNSPGAQLFRMNDHSNEAWSAKVNAFFAATQTRIKAAYKHLSVNYQSFSIFTDGSAQSAWSASVNQLFFKKQLDVTAGANTNDFSNPLIGQEYKSTTVFKSLQATFRRRNWPIISMGYFPSSQITKLGNGQYLENLFYTLVGNMTHSYVWHGLMMNSSLVYTQFYNRASDSGFTYFNTRNLMLSQSLFLDKFTFQLNASGASNQDYELYMLEGKVQHSIGKNLTVGAGIKYNRQTVYNIDQLGYSAEASLRLNRLGQIQLSADKGFIPGMNKQLVPDNTGRLTYLKTF